MGSIVQVPLSTDLPHYTEQVTLDGRVYTLRLQWNARERYWYVHLLDEEEATVLAGGRKVIPLVGEEYPDGLSLSDLRDLSLFSRQLPGILLPYATEPLRRQQDDLDRIYLVYIDEAGVAELAASVAAEAA